MKNIKDLIIESHEPDIQADTEKWIDTIEDFLYDNISTEHTIKLYVTIEALKELSKEEYSDVAEKVMRYVEKFSKADLPPVDEVFFDAVGSELAEESWVDDWRADVVRENTIDL